MAAKRLTYICETENKIFFTINSGSKVRERNLNTDSTFVVEKKVWRVDRDTKTLKKVSKMDTSPVHHYRSEVEYKTYTSKTPKSIKTLYEIVSNNKPLNELTDFELKKIKNHLRQLVASLEMIGDTTKAKEVRKNYEKVSDRLILRKLRK